MARKIIRYRNRQEWLADRDNGIGASEVGTILGLNPFETPYQLWRRKKGLDAPKQENFAMKAGHILEDAVARFYADATQCHIIKNTAEDFTIANADRPFLRVSPDRLYWHDGAKHNEENKCVLECKTTQMDIDGDSLPQHWFCQLQMNMGVAELRHGALAWLTRGREFGYREFTLDSEFYGWMAEEVEKFWKDCIIGGIEPPAVNAVDVLLKSPAHKAGRTVEADEELMEDCRRLKEIREQTAALDSRRKELEDTIKMAMGDAEALVVPGSDRPLVTWRSGKSRSRFDEKKFAEEHPDTYRHYLHTVDGARTFLVK